jgi:hypothetical protein
LVAVHPPDRREVLMVERKRYISTWLWQVAQVVFVNIEDDNDWVVRGGITSDRQIHMDTLKHVN